MIRAALSAGLKLQMSAVWACVLPSSLNRSNCWGSSRTKVRTTFDMGPQKSTPRFAGPRTNHRSLCLTALFSSSELSISQLNLIHSKDPANRTESWLSAQCSLLGKFYCLGTECVLTLLRGCGYIGSFTALALLEAGYKVVLVDNLLNSSEETINRIELISGKRPEFYNVDIRKEEDFDKVFKAHPDIDSVIHFAALKVCLQNFL